MKYKAKRKTPVMFCSSDFVYQEGDILELRLEDFEPLVPKQPTQEIKPPFYSDIKAIRSQRALVEWIEKVTAAVNRLRKEEI